MSNCVINNMSGRLELPTSCESLDGQGDTCETCCQEAANDCFANGQLDSDYYPMDAVERDCASACMDSGTMYVTGRDIYEGGAPGLEGGCRLLSNSSYDDMVNCCTQGCSDVSKVSGATVFDNCATQCIQESGKIPPSTTGGGTTGGGTTGGGATGGGATGGGTTNGNDNFSEWNDFNESLLLTNLTTMVKAVFNANSETSDMPDDLKNDRSELLATCILDKLTTDYNSPEEIITITDTMTDNKDIVKFFLGDLDSDEPNGYLGKCVLENFPESAEITTNIDENTQNTIQSAAAAMTSNLGDSSSKSNNTSMIIIIIVIVLLLAGGLYLYKQRGGLPFETVEYKLK
jgi:hypothetical protein